jgi:hypothetical protein
LAPAVACWGALVGLEVARWTCRGAPRGSGLNLRIGWDVLREVPTKWVSLAAVLGHILALAASRWPRSLPLAPACGLLGALGRLEVARWTRRGAPGDLVLNLRIGWDVLREVPTKWVSLAAVLGHILALAASRWPRSLPLAPACGLLGALGRLGVGLEVARWTCRGAPGDLVLNLRIGLDVLRKVPTKWVSLAAVLGHILALAASRWPRSLPLAPACGLLGALVGLEVARWTCRGAPGDLVLNLRIGRDVLRKVPTKWVSLAAVLGHILALAASRWPRSLPLAPACGLLGALGRLGVGLEVARWTCRGAPGDLVLNLRIGRDV